MKIVCCIKQVPAVDQLQFAAATHTVVREGVDLIINPFDRRAISEAVALKKRLGNDRVEVVAMTMGPPQAEAALRECLALGADRAVHLCDAAFAGSDTLATARVLARALQREGFDLLLFGQYALDADTGQVGPEVAELLGLPCITGVRRIAVEPDRTTLEVEFEVEDGYEIGRAPLPAALTLLDRQSRPVRPSPAALAAAQEQILEVAQAKDLSLTPEIVGAGGSPTWVAGLEVMATQRRGEVLEGLAPQEAAARLADYLVQQGVFHADAAAATVGIPKRQADRTQPAVWVLVEPHGDGLRPVTLELLAKANQLAAQTGGEVVALALDTLSDGDAGTLAAAGADRIVAVPEAAGQDIGGVRRGAALAAVLEQFRPSIFLAPSTPFGREAAARVAARLGLGLTADCLDVAVDEGGRLAQFKPAFGGNIVARIYSRTEPQMATVRPGVLPLPRLDFSRRTPVETVDVGPLPDGPIIIVKSVRDLGKAALALERAPVVIGVGTGIEGDWNLPVVRELAEVLGAAVGGTRRAVETGIMPGQVQIGLTGKAIAPRLYLALGVRGNLNHMIGSLRAGKIVAVNLDPEADIFKAADFGVVGDVLKIVPLLTEELQRRKASG